MEIYEKQMARAYTRPTPSSIRQNDFLIQGFNHPESGTGSKSYRGERIMTIVRPSNFGLLFHKSNRIDLDRNFVKKFFSSLR